MLVKVLTRVVKPCSPGFSMMLVIVSRGFNLPTRSGLPRAGKAPDGYFTAKAGATHPINYRQEIICSHTALFCSWGHI